MTNSGNGVPRVSTYRVSTRSAGFEDIGPVQRLRGIMRHQLGKIGGSGGDRVQPPDRASAVFRQCRFVQRLAERIELLHSLVILFVAPA